MAELPEISHVERPQWHSLRIWGCQWGEEGGTEKIPKPITQCTTAWGLQAIHYRHHCLLRSLSDFQWEGFAQLCADMLMEASILSTR